MLSKLDWIRIESLLDSRRNQEENSLSCPISKELFENPVNLGDGYCYEKKDIERWLTLKSRSPITRQEIVASKLIPNFTIKSLVETYREKKVKHCLIYAREMLDQRDKFDIYSRKLIVEGLKVNRNSKKKMELLDLFNRCNVLQDMKILINVKRKENEDLKRRIMELERRIGNSQVVARPPSSSPFGVLGNKQKHRPLPSFFRN